MLRRPEGATVDEVVNATGWQRHTVRGVFSGEARAHPGLRQRRARSGLSHRRGGEPMSLAVRGTSARQKSDEPSSSIGPAANRQVVNEEALSRLHMLDIGELRQQWRGLYKTQAPPSFSRELLVRAVAYRMQELARGGLRPEPQRQLRRIAQQFKETGAVTVRTRPELRPGTRLVREWQGRTYDVLVLDGGFSWQGTHYRSLSALARMITGTAWSGPLFFGLKPSRPAARRSLQVLGRAREPKEISNAAG